MDEITDGAACTVLKAKEFINSDTPLLIANSDQYLDWCSSEFLYSMVSDNVDGGISTFYSNDTKWSYAKLDNNGYVSDIKEKDPISDHATTGIYYWKKGQNFVKYAEQMIQKDIRVKNEFYVAPVYNEAIKDNLKFKIKKCNKMYGLGVPDDLDIFIDKFKNSTVL
jgi:dTDP-glucose pyrophosphorylase